MTRATENGMGGNGLGQRLGRGSPWTLAIWIGAACLLTAPLIAMRFTPEVAWTSSDFVVMGAILFTACGAFELAVRAQGSLAYRAACGLAILTAFLIVWMTLAVGIIGDNDPVNLLFGVVLLIGLVGGGMMRFEAKGMAAIMVATAIAQAAMIVPAVWRESVEGVILIGLFTLAWLASAWLYGKAAQTSDCRR
jgi:hypothetical protein